MSYEYDIFLSYQRNPETLRWITQHLVPLLNLRLKLELGRDLSVFIDENIESGTDWPLELATALSNSRILIPLWTRTYFNSPWCTEEFSHMIAREKETSRRNTENRYVLVIPVIIHDCETLSKDISHIQHFEIRRCFNVRMSRESPRAEELDEIIGIQASAIANAIYQAPQWRPE